MNNNKKISDDELRLFHICLGLDYNGETIPEFEDLKQMELIALLYDYSEYVESTVKNRELPVNSNNFSSKWNIIFNAHLYKYKKGDEVYFYLDNNKWLKTSIKSIRVENNGEVLCYIDGYDHEVGAGELYYKNKKWE